MPRSLKDWEGHTVTVSDQRYIASQGTAKWVGKPLRRISGIDDSPVPGYHFKPGFVTLCPADVIVACPADFMSFEEKYVQELSDEAPDPDSVQGAAEPERLPIPAPRRRRKKV